MSAVRAKWVVRRYESHVYQSIGDSGVMPMRPIAALTFDAWVDVCYAADTIIGKNTLKIGVEPSVPVVIKQGEHVIVIYMELALDY